MTAGNLKIGVFDSGFGGLTVLRALLPLLPQAASFSTWGIQHGCPMGQSPARPSCAMRFRAPAFCLSRAQNF